MPDAATLSPGRWPRVSWPVQLAMIAALAVELNALCWSTPPRDYELFLGPWYRHIVDHGSLGAFAAPFGNYTPPYLYLLAAATMTRAVIAPLAAIKLLSIAGTAFLTVAVADLLKALETSPRRALLIFVLPSVVINAALLAQCDALWAGACVFALAACIRGQTLRGVLWCGVAIAFKAQAAFFAPVMIGVLIARRSPYWYWGVPALVYAAMMLPAWLLGWPAADLALIYTRQASEFDFAGRLANPWIWGTMFAPGTAKALYPLGYAAAASAAAGIAWIVRRRGADGATLLPLALLSAAALPILLPRMHERYLFLADVLALALAIARPSPRTLFIAAAIQILSFASLLSYMYFYAMPWPTLAASLLAIPAIATIGREVASPLVTPAPYPR